MITLIFTNFSSCFEIKNISRDVSVAFMESNEIGSSSCRQGIDVNERLDNELQRRNYQNYSIVHTNPAKSKDMHNLMHRIVGL